MTYFYNETHFRDGKSDVQYVELWVSDKNKNRVNDCRIKLSWCALRIILKARERKGREKTEEKSKRKKEKRILKGAQVFGDLGCWEMLSVHSQDLNWNHRQVKAHIMVKFFLQLCFLVMSILWFNWERSLSIPRGILSFPNKEIMIRSCWLRKGQNKVIKLLPGRGLMTRVLLTAL